ncbi:hypothetical protein C8R47DRAFT_1074093 [Mycena vitilis]|nr:hypothetical protein C8R47DRAFT_1074093 [Mycena vitilis]
MPASTESTTAHPAAAPVNAQPTQAPPSASLSHGESYAAQDYIFATALATQGKVPRLRDWAEDFIPLSECQELEVRREFGFVAFSASKYRDDPATTNSKLGSITVQKAANAVV